MKEVFGVAALSLEAGNQVFPMNIHPDGTVTLFATDGRFESISFDRALKIAKQLEEGNNVSKLSSMFRRGGSGDISDPSIPLIDRIAEFLDIVP